jgi:hypothetical protein
MANTIKIKNSGTANNEPSANSLSYGELAINYRDGKIFFKDHLGGVGYFEGTTSDVPISPGGDSNTPTDSQVLSWMDI